MRNWTKPDGSISPCSDHEVNPALLLLFVVTLPFALMGAAYAYALTTQDATNRCVVMLDDGPPVRVITARHARKYGLIVQEMWDSGARGYRAVVPTRHLRALRNDPEVLDVRKEED